MTEKLYYWAENLNDYSSDNEQDYDQIIEIKRLNFFIGKNNAGKSRFLRNLFTTSQKLKDYIIYDIQNDPTFHKFSNDFQRIDIIRYSLQEEFASFKEIHGKKLIQTPKRNNFQFSDNISTKISKGTLPTRLDTISNLINNLKEHKKLITNLSFSEKYYLPVLRGMRPVTGIENKQPYIERAQKDYFDDKSKFNTQNIITGESLYQELKQHLLGEPEQRDLIKNYEENLSQYFFDNEPITLIPKHDQDVVNIKIGNDKQRPIYELGDGLQQAIILTYETYIKKYDEDGNEQTHAFFIEEPELHMHAGMVRQLMNFYLNETNHYYFFTTHSNHLLDMADESDQVIIQKFVKQPKEDSKDGFDFRIHRCDRDRDLLASLGIKPSSVYLANCTIWVEGITDRLYIIKYMEKYLAELEKSDSEQYKKYRRFMPNYHYTFVEYAGSNLVHWNFSEEFTDHLNDQGMNALLTTSSVLLIADGDIQGKGNRVEQLTESLGEQFYLLACKETENTLPFKVINRVAKSRFERMNIDTKEDYDFDLISNINSQNYFDHTEYGIGRLLDEAIKIPNQNPSKNPFADGAGVGTIKKKLDFCREIIKDFDENPDWQLTPKAKELCERIFQHIEKCNS